MRKDGRSEAAEKGALCRNEKLPSENRRTEKARRKTEKQKTVQKIAGGKIFLSARYFFIFRYSSSERVSHSVAYSSESARSFSASFCSSSHFL